MQKIISAHVTGKMATESEPGVPVPTEQPIYANKLVWGVSEAVGIRIQSYILY